MVAPFVSTRPLIAQVPAQEAEEDSKVVEDTMLRMVFKAAIKVAVVNTATTLIRNANKATVQAEDGNPNTVEEDMVSLLTNSKAVLVNLTHNLTPNRMAIQVTHRSTQITRSNNNRSQVSHRSRVDQTTSGPRKPRAFEQYQVYGRT